LDNGPDLFSGPVDPSDAAEAERVSLGRRVTRDEYDELDAEALAEIGIPVPGYFTSQG
jgi:hypothetical protein